jgi:hypothetical protein
VAFNGLSDNQTITTKELEIVVQAYVDQNFESVSLQYGLGKKPDKWITLVDPINHQFKSPDTIYTWDISELPAGIVTLRLVMQNKDGGYAEKQVMLNLQVPTPTPTLTPTPLPTETPSPTELPTQTPLPTNTSLPTEVPTEVPTVELTLTPTLP